MTIFLILTSDQPIADAPTSDIHRSRLAALRAVMGKHSGAFDSKPNVNTVIFKFVTDTDADAAMAEINSLIARGELPPGMSSVSASNVT